MFLIASIPTLLYLLIAYNALVFFSPTPTIELLSTVLLQINMPSGSTLIFTIESLFIALGTLALYIEVVKSTRVNMESMMEQMLSTLALLVFVFEFLLLKQAGTHTFFVLTLMQLVDVLAGITVSVSTARRDISLHD